MSFTDILARKLARDVKELQNTGVDLTARELINDLASKTVVTLNHQFADATARDAYFTANPTELVDKLFIKVGIGYQQYLESAWQDVSAVVTEQLTADQQALNDVGDYFTDKTTEGALQEVGSELSNIATDLNVHKEDYANLVTEVNKKANKQQEEWITPTTINGATLDATFPLRYRKDSLGYVCFKGKVNITNGTVIFMNIPNGYLPAYSGYYPISKGEFNGATPVIAYLYSGGTMNIYGTGTFDLSNIQYYAEK